MKPKKIKITEKNECAFLKTDEVYDVVKWHRYTGNPQIEFKPGAYAYLMPGEWEPVQDFKHGDPVWAWDYDERCKMKGIYVGPYPEPVACLVHVVKCGAKGISVFKQVEHRKPTITLKEIAKRADIDLDEYEIVEEG